MEELVVIPALSQLSNSHQDIKEPLPMPVEIQADLVAIVSIHHFLFNFTSCLLNYHEHILGSAASKAIFTSHTYLLMKHDDCLKCPKAQFGGQVSSKDFQISSLTSK